jgi:hypothetical protein
MDVFWVVAPCSQIGATDASEVLSASIIKVLIRIQGAKIQKTAFFIIAAVRT